MRVEDSAAVRGFVRLCGDGWRMGWHERNGGNLTYRMTPGEVEEAAEGLDFSAPYEPLGVEDKRLAGEYFITTGTGKYFMNVERDPESNIGIVRVGEDGASRQTVWGLAGGGRPTSEFPSHYLNHCVKSAADPSYRVIYHAHPVNVIAMTFILPPDARAFSRALWRSMSECPLVFPGGVGVVDWMVPGGADIAEATSRLMTDFDAVVWAHHGLFAAGPDFDTTFGLMHTVEKAADIYLRVLGTGKPVLGTMTDDNIRAIARDFGVAVREEFLD